MFTFNLISGLGLRSDYLGSRAGLTDLHGANSLASTDFHFSLEASRLTSPRPGSIRASMSRKRALSSSPYSDSFDLGSMIRYSPTSLAASLVNGSRSSSASGGSYGHLSAGNLSPVLGLHAAMPPHIQHLLRSGSLLHSLPPGHPLSPTSSMFSLAHHPAHLRHSLQGKNVSNQIFRFNLFHRHYHLHHRHCRSNHPPPPSQRLNWNWLTNFPN